MQFIIFYYLLGNRYDNSQAERGKSYGMEWIYQSRIKELDEIYRFLKTIVNFVNILIYIFLLINLLFTLVLNAIIQNCTN